MSRPLQQKLFGVLGRIESALMREDVSLPFDASRDISDELRIAEQIANELVEFVSLSNQAMEALEGLAAAWPETEIVGKLEPENKPVLSKEKAIDQAAAVLIKYREISGDFTT